MTKLNEALNHIRFYASHYRHPDMDAFSISGLYDLYPNKNTQNKSEANWPDTWLNVSNAGIYIFLDDHLDIVYLGKAGNFGYRLSCYFKYDINKGCKAKHSWNIDPRFVVTVAVPENTEFECLALEEYLLSKIKTSDNTRGNQW